MVPYLLPEAGAAEAGSLVQPGVVQVAEELGTEPYRLAAPAVVAHRPRRMARFSPDQSSRA